MRVEIKNVFYCDFCRKRRLSRSAMEKHELYCTMNPERECRWWLNDDHAPPHRRQHPLLSGRSETHRMRRGLALWVRMFAPLTEERIKRLREHALGCPACMLAAVRQAGLDIFSRDRFDYDEEVKRYREEEHEYWLHEERREIESSWL